MKLEGWSSGDKVIGAAVVAGLTLMGIHVLFGLGDFVSSIGSALASPNASGWAQAIGTVIAVLATGGVAWWEAHQRRVEDANRKKEAVLARLMLVQMLANRLNAYCQRIANHTPGTPLNLNNIYGQLRLIMVEVDSIELREVPTQRAVNYLLTVRAEIANVREILNKTGPMPPVPSDLAKLQLSGSEIGTKARLLPYAVQRWGKDGPGI